MDCLLSLLNVHLRFKQKAKNTNEVCTTSSLRYVTILWICRTGSIDATFIGSLREATTITDRGLGSLTIFSGSSAVPLNFQDDFLRISQNKDEIPLSRKYIFGYSY